MAFRYLHEEQECVRLPRRQGAADMMGELYEVGIASLLFARGMFEASSFSLFTNMDETGAFDDLVFCYEEKNTNKQLYNFVQLKYKKNRPVTSSELCAKSGKISLLKYFDSFCCIHRKFMTDHAEFIIHTNASFRGNIKGKSSSRIVLSNFLNTTRSEEIIVSFEKGDDEYRTFEHLRPYIKVLEDISVHKYSSDIVSYKLKPFSQLDHCKRLLTALKDRKIFDLLLSQQLSEELTINMWESFMNKLRLYTCQASGKGLDDVIKATLKKYLGTEQMFLKFQSAMILWWKKPFTLSEKCAPFWFSMLEKHIHDLVSPLSSKLSVVSELKFRDTESMSSRVINYIVEGHTELSCLRVHQYLSEAHVGYIMIDSNTLQSRTDEVISIWKFGAWCKVLVVDGGVKDDSISDRIADIIHNNPEKQIIWISNGIDKCTSSCSKLSQAENHNRNFSFFQLEDNSQSKILNCKVDFQGSLVKLENLTDKANILDALDEDLVLQLLLNETPCKVGERIPNMNPSYINRTLFRKEYISKDIFMDKTSLKLAISGISLNNLQSLLPLGETVVQYKTDACFGNSSCYRFFVINSDNDFNSICKAHNDIHWIHFSDGRFVWKLSNGVLDPIIKYLEQDEVIYDQINSFMDLAHQMIVILGPPGMGKSMELEYMASYLKQINPSTWVVKVNLNDHTECLKDAQSRVEELLLKAGNLYTMLEKALFQYQLKFGKNIVVFFDGLDEISPNYTKKIMEMLKCLCNYNIRKVWVTSRDIMKDKIKDFHVLPFGFQPFTDNDQVKFLSNSWKITNGSETLLNKFILNLLKMTNESLKDPLTKFSGIPLQTYMLAEVFRSQAMNFCRNRKFSLPSELHLFSLYKEFVDIKWKVFCGKMKMDATKPGVEMLLKPTKELTQQHIMNCALVTLLDDEISHLPNSKEILSQNSQFLAKFNTGEEIAGLIVYQQNEKAVFVHQTFAEYFAAIWFTENYHFVQECLQRWYISKKFGVIRQFVDQYFSSGKELHLAVMNQNIGKIKELLSENNSAVNDIDNGGRTALHLAIANFLNVNVDNQNDFHIYSLYLEFGHDIKNSVVTLTEIVNVLLMHGADSSLTDNVLSWSPMRLAEEINAWSLVDVLLNYRSDPEDLVLIPQKIKDDTFLRDIVRTAARRGYINLIAFMIKCGLSVSFSFELQETMLNIAACNGHVDLIQFLISKHANIESRDLYGYTPFMKSAFRGNEEAAIKLLELGANCDTVDKFGNSVIHYAAKGNLPHLLELILKPNCSIDMTNNEGVTPLMGAALEGNEQVAIVLLKHGANPHIIDKSGNNVMHYVALRNIVCLVKLLLESGCEIDISNGEGVTPLMRAVAMGNKEVAITLLQYGANPHAKDKSGSCVMHYAVERNIPELIETLMNFKCDVNCSNTEGVTPLMKAATFGREEVVVKLLHLGAKADAKDKFGNSVMHYVAVRNVPGLVDLLLESECTIDRSNNEGVTPLLRAVSMDNEEVAMKLLNHGASPHANDISDNTVMHYAVERNMPELVDLLFKCRCHIDSGNNEGVTPLMKAALMGKEDVAIKLLQHGANPHAVSKSGNSVIHYATKGNNPRLVTLLSKYDYNGENCADEDSSKR
ncbi:hypothetical protein C0J52_10757 [Blattella germanica]|nr:hypothetical protein C0J52_10757 [Blattella germanica]